jgi:hypothetical protein
MKAIGVYQLYCCVKNHFNTKSYDMVKYRYKMNISEDAFHKRNDKKLFEMLSYSNVISNKNKDEVADFFTAIFKRYGPVYISKIITNLLEYDKLYKKHIELIDDYVNHGKYFIKDLLRFNSNYETFFRDFESNRPMLFNEAEYNRINVETVCVLNILSKGKIFKIWKDCKDTLVKKRYLMYNKYNIYLQDKIDIEMHEDLFRKWLNSNV